MFIASEAEPTSSSYTLDRNLHNPPTCVVSASGLYLTLEDGRKILDATGGAAVSCIGHGNPRVKEAIMKQMDDLSYCHSMFFSHRAAEKLGKEIVGAESAAAKAGMKDAKLWVCCSGQITRTIVFRPA